MNSKPVVPGRRQLSRGLVAAGLRLRSDAKRGAAGRAPMPGSGKDQDVTAHRYDLVILSAGGGNLLPGEQFAGGRIAVATAGGGEAGRNRRVARTVRRLAATRVAEMHFEPITAR